MEENKDYELIPHGDDQWHVRILEGDFTETVIQFRNISVGEEIEGDSDSAFMRYNFDIISTPDPFLASESIDENFPLQKDVSEILLSIMESASEKA